MRHLRYEKLSDIDHDVVKKLIQQAIMVDCT